MEGFGRQTAPALTPRFCSGDHAQPLFPRLASRLLFALLAVGLFIGTGCGGSTGPKKVPVSGTVTYQGQAVVGATVSFLGDGTKPPAIGVTDDSGNFYLQSVSGTGAVPGTHQVTVSKRAAPPPAANTKMSMDEAAKAAQKPAVKQTAPASLIPVKYETAATSGLSYTVKEGATNDFKIELTD